MNHPDRQRRRRVNRWPDPPRLRTGLSDGGLRLLREHPGAAGGVLRHLCEGALLWADAAEEERGTLFLPEARARRLAMLRGVGLVDVRRELRRLTRGLSATGADGRVPLACRRVADWADERGHAATALSYQEAAARADPDDADSAYRLGRMLREAADTPRAEAWFRESEERARRAGSGTARARALIGLGNLYLQRGRIPDARQTHARALAVAERHGAHEVAAMANHDLFAMAAAAGDAPTARRHAAAALRGYGVEHPRLPSLTHDVACMLMDQGEFGGALDLFLALYPAVRPERERLLTLGSIARAAGAMGRRRTYLRAHRRIRRFAATQPDHPGLPQALLALARGAASLGAWKRAEAAARRALERAAARGEAAVRFSAEALLEEIAGGRRAAEPRPDPTPATASGRALARRFRTALRERVAAG